MQIYKIIHQIWMQGFSEAPDEIKKYMKINKKLNNDFKYEFWNESKIIELMTEHDYIETYNEFIYMHQKIDFAKYVILYYYGGIYIDGDAVCQKKISPLLEENINYDFIVSKLNCNYLENYIHCNHLYCINNGIIYSKPKTKILKILIDDIVEDHYCMGNMSKMTCIERTTGPTRLTTIVVKNLNDKIKILEPEYIEPCVLDVCHITKNTYIVHKHNGSWFTPKTKKLFTFYMNNKDPLYALIIVIIVIIIMVILYYNEYIEFNYNL
jgi:mannosyltransferase OCH1-like enzyme